MALVYDLRGWNDASDIVCTGWVHLATKRVPHGPSHKLIIGMRISEQKQYFKGRQMIDIGSIRLNFSDTVY